MVFKIILFGQGSDDADKVVGHDDISSLESPEYKSGRDPGRKWTAKRIRGLRIDNDLQLVVNDRVQFLEVEMTVLRIVLGKNQWYVRIFYLKYDYSCKCIDSQQGRNLWTFNNIKKQFIKLKFQDMKTAPKTLFLVLKVILIWIHFYIKKMRFLGKA